MRVEFMLLFRWLVDVLLAVWFFRPIKAERPASRLQTVGGFACLCSTILIYVFIDFLSGDFPWDVPRFLFRAGMYAAYLRLVKRISWKRSVYFALMCWIAVNICSNMFLTPALRKLYFVKSVSEISAGTVVAYLAYAAVITAISRQIPFRRITAVNRGRLFYLLTLAALQLYIKATLNVLTVTEYSGPVELSAYLIFLQLILGLSMVFFEQFLCLNQQQQEARIADLSREYRYENVRVQQQADAEVRRMHHDMKNHLLALRELSSDDARLQEYIGGMMEDLAGFEQRTRTGNDLLDGIFAAKMRQAAAQGVDLLVDLDFSACNYLEDRDLCNVFGNLLDNAIEAACKLEDEQYRSVLVKGRPAANQMAISFSNYYAGTIEFAGSLPRSTKQDAAHHGIGLSSVKKSLAKYEGTLAFRTTPEHRLIVTVLLPQKDGGSAQPM